MKKPKIYFKNITMFFQKNKTFKIIIIMIKKKFKIYLVSQYINILL